MSERTERVVRVWESVLRQDPAWDEIAPDVVYVQHFGQHGGEHVGHDAIRAWLEDVRKVWSTTEGTVEGAEDVGDAVQATFHLRVDSAALEVAGHFRGRLRAAFDDDGRIARLEIWEAGAGW
jgi:hypothetical protein